MSDHVSRSYADCEGRSSNTTRAYQSMWMGHWGGTSCNTGRARQVDSGLSLRHESSGDPVNTKNLPAPLKDEIEPSSQRLALSLANFPETDRNYGSSSKFSSFPATSSTEEHVGKMNNSGLALAVPCTDIFTKLIEGRPNAFEKGKLTSLMSRYESKEHFPNTDLAIMGQTTRSSVFPREEKIDNNPPSKKLNRSMFLHNPSSNKTVLPVFMGQQLRDMQNISKISTETPSQCQECYALPGNKHCIHKAKTSNIFATSDSTEEFDDPTRNGFPLGDTMLPTQSKVDMFGKFLKFTSDGGLFREKSGVKLQLLSSSSDSDGKCSNKDGLSNPQLLKNESSAETDTMDMEALREQNVLSGLNSSVQNKDNLVAGTTFSSLHRKGKEIQGMTQNQVSASQFLSKELPNPFRLNSRPHMVDPGSRWLKRLKLINVSADSLVISAKRSNPEEEQPPPFFLRENNKRQKSKVEEKATRKEEKSNIAQGRDTLISHAWIQRWCRNKVVDTNGKIGNEVIRKPKKFKLESEVEFQNKQFPSIGAMALMGKTLAGFQSIELTRKGSSFVWNT
ncbi:F-box protein At2g16365-like [Impatiens glandulifera]|uniref:F-box protein At2g16365-like n=1 Tax=Impatiens glandulifera TaxID=253017 RepID=UPI001FB11403|nr:F-box protein At2g16365-like [Impatiens glandulifera]